MALIGRGYRCAHDGPFTFTDGEIAEVRWVDRAALDDLMATERFVPDNVALLLPLLHSLTAVTSCRSAELAVPSVGERRTGATREEDINMTMYGANPEQLASLGRSLKQQITSIEGVMSTVSSALGGTTWVGPARDQFESDWNTSFRTALNKLNQAFDAAGSDCIARSTDLQRVMGAR